MRTDRQLRARSRPSAVQAPDRHPRNLVDDQLMRRGEDLGPLGAVDSVAFPDVARPSRTG